MTIRKDLTGKQFGHWLVLSQGPNNLKNGQIQYYCICRCGKQKLKPYHHLAQGMSKSCGCKRHKDIKGQRFGMLVGIKRVKTPPNTSTKWLFRCDCGNEYITRLSCFNKGQSNPTNCGCIRKKTGKLSYKDIKEIREIYATDRFALSGLAEIYGVDPSYISRIVNKKRKFKGTI